MCIYIYIYILFVACLPGRPAAQPPGSLPAWPACVPAPPRIVEEIIEVNIGTPELPIAVPREDRALPPGVPAGAAAEYFDASENVGNMGLPGSLAALPIIINNNDNNNNYYYCYIIISIIIIIIIIIIITISIIIITMIITIDNKNNNNNDNKIISIIY